MRIKADALSNLDGLEHGFFTREGGVSSGLYGSLNCGFGSSDDHDNVAENRRRIARELGSDQPVSTVYQVHSADVETITAPLDLKTRRKADALVTKTPGVPLGILTADCVPVLFADHQNGVVGAAHAGWKGAFSGILENTVLAMENLGASRDNILAVAGPSISAAAYEVGAEFKGRFVEKDPHNEKFFTPSDRSGHHMFDLPGYVVDRLKAFGIQYATSKPECTYRNSEKYFSYRRTTHNDEPDYGRQLSVILIKA